MELINDIIFLKIKTNNFTMNFLMELLKHLEHSRAIQENIKINPQWLAGFIEAEGHFHGKAGQ